MNLIEVKDLSKSYPGRDRPALGGVTFHVASGEILGLVGLNGSGKTTLIRMMAGISLPSSGNLWVGGHDVVREKAEAGQLTGWVSEFPTFDPSARALGLLSYYGSLYGLSGSEARRRGTELLADVGLTGQENARLRSFSQGMVKRFALARALMGDPDCILLDEVLNGLDPEGLLLVRNLMSKLREGGTSVFLSSHILSEVEHIANRVLILHEGKLVRTFARDELLASTDTTIELRLSNQDAAALEFLATLGRVETDGPLLRLLHATLSPEELNTELVRRGYRVSALNVKRPSLEDLFFAEVGASSKASGAPGGRT